MKKYPHFYFVEYKLYDMEKNIIFQTFSQYQGWLWALNKLNEDEDNEGYIPFKVISIREERY